jgi:ornithine cyclodeaminase/alanine dehydrogenase-like protein (mu-crystallin family)
VLDCRPEAAERFASEMSGRLGIDIEASGDVRAAVEAADVIVTATTSHEPLFDGRWLRDGVHINGIGSHAAAARELDSATMARARIVTDQTAACLAEAGDLIIPLREGVFAETHIHAQLGEIVAGLRPGRTDDREITVFKSVGLAIQDVATAVAAYRKARTAGRGQALDA